MEENKETRSEELLASFRVLKAGNLEYRAIAMTTEEILARRAYIRKALRDTERSNLSNEILDNIRLVTLENKSYMFEDTWGYEYFIKAAGITKEESEFRRIHSMIPFEFMGLKGNNFDWNIYEADIRRAKDYVNNFILKFEQFREKGMGLYIYSKTKGSGKTMLSCCILNELSERYPVSVKFINSLDLLELTKQAYKGQEPEELKALYTAAVLVVDDIGVQMSKEWIDTIFYRLVNVRYNSRLVTIYTSNIASESLKMDDRIVDRIESTTYLVELPEVPVRQKIRKQEKDKIMDAIKKSP